MKKPACAAILAIDLRYAILQGDHPILIPELEAVANFDGDNDKIRALKSLSSNCVRRQCKIQAMSLDKGLCGFINAAKSLSIDIYESNMRTFE
jgi:hypothetical protein